MRKVRGLFLASVMLCVGGAQAAPLGMHTCRRYIDSTRSRCRLEPRTGELAVQAKSDQQT
jgi:hypothetical protein